MDFKNIFILVVAVTSLVTVFYVYLNDRHNKINKAFLVLILNATLWNISMFLYRDAVYHPLTLIYAKLLYSSALFLPISFLYLIHHMVRKKATRYYFILFTILAILFLPILNGWFGNGMIKDVIVQTSGEPVIIFNNLLYYIYMASIVIPFSIGISYLLSKYVNTRNNEKKLMYFFLGLGVFIPSVVSIISNLFLPFLGFYEWNWVGQLSVGIAPLFVMYGVYKYKMFNIKPLIADALVFVIFLQSFFALIINDDISELIADLVSFILILIIGFWLLKTVKKYEDLTVRLQNNVKKLNELNEQLKELSRKKTEFLSIATHQLRAPVTIMRGHLSLIIEGSYGKVPKYLAEPLNKVFYSTERLAHTITDFLNVSRIEQGRMEYSFSNVELLPLIEGVFAEVKELADKKGLKLSIEKCAHANGDEPIFIYADKDKIRHVIFNIVENAIKYTEKGSVSIRICTNEFERLQIKISDTGAGIPKEELKNLFDKFVRAKNVYGINVEGAGLGLYIAREIIYAHNGRIWAESEGEGKGSTFIIELPILNKKGAVKKDN